MSVKDPWDPVIGAISDVDEVVVGDRNAVHGVELLGSRSREQARVRRLSSGLSPYAPQCRLLGELQREMV